MKKIDNNSKIQETNNKFISWENNNQKSVEVGNSNFRRVVLTQNILNLQDQLVKSHLKFSVRNEQQMQLLHAFELTSDPSLETQEDNLKKAYKIIQEVNSICKKGLEKGIKDYEDADNFANIMTLAFVVLCLLLALPVIYPGIYK